MTHRHDTSVFTQKILDPEDTSWVEPSQSAISQQLELQTDSLDFRRLPPRRPQNSKQSQQSFKQLRWSSIQFALTIQKTRVKLQYGKHTEAGDVCVVAYNRLDEREMNELLSDNAKQFLTSNRVYDVESMRQGLLDISSATFIQEGRKKIHKETMPIIVVRIPEWGTDYDREFFFKSVQNVLNTCNMKKIKKICLPWIGDPLAPYQDVSELTIYAINDYLNKTSESSVEQIIVRINEAKRFNSLANSFRKRIIMALENTFDLASKNR